MDLEVMGNCIDHADPVCVSIGNDESRTSDIKIHAIRSPRDIDRCENSQDSRCLSAVVASDDCAEQR